jgi:hypothetical protein
MPVNRHFLLFLLFLCSGFVFGQRIEFFMEELIFTLDSSSFSVNGDYYFRNPSSSALDVKIFFPVSKAPGYSAVDTMLIYDISRPTHPLTAEINDSVATFSLSFLPFSEKCVKIYYKQHHDGSRARYILLTTQKWRKPLASAKYSLIANKNIIVSHFSIPPDQSEDFGETRVYFWNRQQFIPEKDFLFDFLVNH